DRIYARPHLVAAVANCNLAYALQDTNALDEALHYFDRAMAIDEALQRSDPHAESCRYGRARARLHAGDLTGAAADLAADRRMFEAMGEPRSRAWLNHCLLDARIRRARDPRASLEPFLLACEQVRAPADGPSTAYVEARAAFL